MRRLVLALVFRLRNGDPWPLAWRLAGELVGRQRRAVLPAAPAPAPAPRSSSRSP